MNMLAAMSFWRGAMGLLIVGVCCILIIVILLQRGRGGGLAGAFGGSGGSSAFGAKTGDVFTWITVVVATVFILLAVVANFVFDESKPPVVAAAPAPEPIPATLPVTVDEEGRVTPVGNPPGITITPVADEPVGDEKADPQSESESSTETEGGTGSPTSSDGPAGEAGDDAGSAAKPDPSGDDDPPDESNGTP